MVSIAEPIAKPAPPFRFILDRREVLGSVFLAPAILYVLLLVGVPFLVAVYYAVSAYTIYNPSWRFVGLTNFEDILEDPVFLQTLGNTFLFTFVWLDWATNLVQGQRRPTVLRPAAVFWRC